MANRKYVRLVIKKAKTPERNTVVKHLAMELMTDANITELTKEERKVVDDFNALLVTHNVVGAHFEE